ncbi:TonB-dependent siderophore receptor [Synoicihabitans lomoniglobus]|uniref:TonB-dependent receptor n=1 Tax=Synoicihabitans lomoniglobus TaxID=2909285 RepID=A0AAF0CPK0_9BACT|nr:TonB-dependent receptor [Opitutaceae bacterium LMO-M01]WED65149.1 TonB-dependent receptor [Opitutaceae bacterium LMO-M01]
MAFALFAGGSGLFAQSTNETDSSSSAATDDDVIFLSPFEVTESDDVGYRASNTTSGTSLNTAIKDLPMTIQVVTEEFMSDIGATDFEEALAYSSGVFTDSMEAPGGGNSANANAGGGSNEKSVSASAGGSRFANVATIRGFDVPFQTRFGFRVGGVVITPTTNIALGGLLDAVNIDRLEVVKGPNSLLYGIGVLSGIVNTMPKTPTSEPGLTVSASVGNYGFKRGTLEATGPIVRSNENGHSLSARVAGAWEERDDYTDWRTKELDYEVVQLEYGFRDKANVLLEYQRSHTKFNGTGSEWIYDTGGNDPFFRNAWDENYNFARHVGPIQTLGQLNRSIVTTDANGRPLRTPRVELTYQESDPRNRQLMGGGLPDTYRITGPDTYEMRDEDNFLLNIDLTPTENLAFSGGVYYTAQETEEMAVNVQNFTNGGGGVSLRNTLSAIGDTEYTVDDVWAAANTFYIDRDNLNPANLNLRDNTKITRYWWSKRPNSSDSLQWRLRGTYSFETELPLLGETKHTLLAGNHFINDRVSFLNGDEDIVRAYDRDTAADDALYFRPIDDYSVMRYQGENLAMPGLRFSEQEIWFKGFYGVYQGNYLGDRLGFLGGVRYDEYNASTRDFIRIDPAETTGMSKEQIQSQEVGYVNNPDNVTYGSFEAQDNFPAPIENWSKSLALNFKITDAFTFYGLYSEGIAPNTGLTDGNNEFIDAEETVSRELGLKFSLMDNRLTGSIAAYSIKRKNAIWDFDFAPAPAKWNDSTNPPVGLSLNAARFDPHPEVGTQTLSYGINVHETPEFFQNAFVAGSSSTTDAESLHQTFYITTRDDDNNPVRQQIPGLIAFANYGGTADSPQVFYVEHSEMDTPFDFSYRNSDGNFVTETYSWRQWFESAFFNQSVSSASIGQQDPLSYRREESFFGEFHGGNNPSLDTSSGANVTFADESIGGDLEIIFQPSPSLQFLFNYSYTQREAKGAFNMVDYISLATGEEFAGTEYSRIVQVFGREAFGIQSQDTNGDGVADLFLDQHGEPLSASNPLRPSEAISGIDGVSLFFNPAHQAAIWGRYEFDEGVLKDFGFGLGAKFSSAAATSVTIGGAEIGQNLFPTPDTAAHLTLNAGLYYKFELGRTRWSLRLNINNLLDERYDVTTAAYYDDYNARPINKRSEVFYGPRTFRLTTTVQF